MRKPKSELREWFTRSEMARILAITPSSFDRYWRRHAPPDGQRVIGGKLYFHCRRLLDNAVAVRTPAVDPLLDGQPTEALEDYRRAKAGQEQLKLEEMRERYADVGEFREALAGDNVILRAAAERMRREPTLTGADAAKVLADAVAAVEIRWAGNY